MKVNVKRAQFEAKQVDMKAQRLRMITYAIALGCSACRGKWKFGKKRLDGLVRGAYEEITEWYEHYGGNPPEEGMVPDNVPTLYYGMRIQIKALNVPLKEIEAEYPLSPEFPVWRNKIVCEKRKYRFEEAESLRMITRAYWYAMLLYLWHTYGNGETTLSEIYREIHGEWNRTLDTYLKCDDRQDALVKARIDKVIQAIEQLGVKL